MDGYSEEMERQMFRLFDSLSERDRRRSKRSCDTSELDCESIETAKHDIEKTETTTGLKVVVRIIDKVYKPDADTQKNSKRR